MTQALLKAGQKALLIAGFDVDHPVRRKTRLGQRGGEEIRTGDAPENLSDGARCDPGGEESRRRSIHGAGAAAGDFMQGAQRQTAVWQFLVKRLQPERQNAATGAAGGFDFRDFSA